MLRPPLRTSPEMGVGRWGVIIHATPVTVAGTVPKTRIALYQAFWERKRPETDTSLPMGKLIAGWEAAPSEFIPDEDRAAAASSSGARPS